ncbi:MAG TPA: hypothetical protein VGR03_05380, partial [Candidatus Acidoferrum sp.]|nr:hypothetical protein [Candidatus Acidoferrum sp.]
MNQPDSIAVAAILIGFGLTTIMFRVQRELYVREVKKEENWIAWADFLIFASVLLVLLLIVVPLFAFSVQTFAPAASAAAFILQAGYIPAILAHYRIGIGKGRNVKGLVYKRGEPAEKWIVCVSGAIALLFF